MNLYWGDIHAHCSVSYGNGTPQCALANAREHLDFCSITGHAFWPDIPMDVPELSKGICEHLGGFAKLKYFWSSLMSQLEQANQDGKFVTIPSYEWHSLKYGDRNCYFDSCDVKLLTAATVKGLAQKLDKQNTDYMILPHHCAYAKGHRGIDWESFDSRSSPLVEIYSSHGCGESDDAPYEYHHSMGPRVAENTILKGLLAGYRFGFIASTDNHEGYPGHYGHGCVGISARTLDRKAVWGALQNRRTIASTGARIKSQFRLGSAEFGSVIGYKADLPLVINIEGTNSIDKVELIESSGPNWRVRHLPIGFIYPHFESGRYKIKVETGWGIGTAYSDWLVEVILKEARLLSCTPCFRFGRPDVFDIEVCNRIIGRDSRSVKWACSSVPNPAGMMGGTHSDPGGTQAVILEIESNNASRLEVKTGKISFDLSLRDLATGSVAQHTGHLGSPAIKIHRAVPEREFSYSYEEIYDPIGNAPGFVYLRVTQCDGQVAWISPIWFE